jgi:site-specific recombinase XerD
MEADLRLMERIRLRVKDLDFTQSLIYVRTAKSGKDRLTLITETEIYTHVMQKSIDAVTSPVDQLDLKSSR